MSFQSRAFFPQQSSSSSVSPCAVGWELTWQWFGRTGFPVVPSFELFEGYAFMEMDSVNRHEWSMNQSEKLWKRHNLSRCSNPWHHGHQVVGGVEHGGIIVRSGSELTSEILESRLSTGSVIKARWLVGSLACLVDPRWSLELLALFAQELTTRDGRIEYEPLQRFQSLLFNFC